MTDDLARRLDANLAQVEANMDAIDANLRLVKSARWRFLRNRRLVDRSWELLIANDRLLAQNRLLLLRRGSGIPPAACGRPPEQDRA